MVTGARLAERRAAIAAAADLTRLRARLAERAAPLLAHPPVVPAVKALLSTDGGVCARDGTPLRFDPWSPHAHRCPRCGTTFIGERHDRAWARPQHLWLAERTAHLAAVGVLGGPEGAAAGARELLVRYGDVYFACPNRDNVLGPSRLFFSTYLESIWVTSYLAAATLLRAAGRLDADAEQVVSRVADEAATLIGEFDEGFSNRQTWNDAALAAIAVWFGDEDLLARAAKSETGLIAHLLRGFGPDGMWFEGENYHLFALRGLLTGFGWLRAAGVDPCVDPELAAALTAALRAPTLSALPDFTFPARKDARYGVSLGQPMYLELWELGVAWLGGAAGKRGSGADGSGAAEPGGCEAGGNEAAEPGGRGAGVRGAERFEDWLAALYRLPAPPAEPFDSYLHEAGEPLPARRGREDLSWWMLLEMAPALAGDAERWRPRSVLLESQGLAVLRAGDRYASLECGRYGGGHGHPDRLHLTLHQGGVHWLPDPGAGSYVSRDLFWYRSTLAHNAPRLEGAVQPVGDAECEYFEAPADAADATAGGWGWMRGRYGDVTRTVVSGPEYLLDIVELASADEHLLELPFHLAGEVTLRTPGTWEPATVDGASEASEFVCGAQRFRPAEADQSEVALVACVGDAALAVTLQLGDGELLRATGPSLPGQGPAPFLVARRRGKAVRFVAVLAANAEPLTVRTAGAPIEVDTPQGVHRHQSLADGWQVVTPHESVTLRGRRPVARATTTIVPRPEPPKQTGTALHVADPPALGGSLDGFDLSEPLTLDYEDQYRRSEEPYPGPETLSAVAYANWDADALYLAVEVTKDEPIFRTGDAAPLGLDNEPDDIHSDGLQVYLRPEPDGPAFGFLVVPDPHSSAVRVRVAGGAAGDPTMVAGAWARSETGYAVTLALSVPGWDRCDAGDRIGFDLLVNEMRAGRQRRAGQLVWSGGGGWVWLRGDRQDPRHFGILELA